MSPHLETILQTRYPELFTEASWPKTSYSAMALGCQCPDHWFEGLNLLFQNLTQEMHRPLLVPFDRLETPSETFAFLPPRIILTSVKEKYGSLRIDYREDFADIPESLWQGLKLEKFYCALKSYSRRIQEMIDLADGQFGPTPLPPT